MSPASLKQQQYRIRPKRADVVIDRREFRHEHKLASVRVVAHALDDNRATVDQTGVQTCVSVPDNVRQRMPKRGREVAPHWEGSPTPQACWLATNDGPSLFRQHTRMPTPHPGDAELVAVSRAAIR